MSCERIERLLKDVPHQTFSHPPAYTALDTVNALKGVKPGNFVKVVVFGVDGNPVLVLVPANCSVKHQKVRRRLGAQKVRRPKEKEFVPYFKQLGVECEAGAIYPFGNLFGLPVLIDQRLLETTELVFKAGSHERVIRMLTRDFRRLLNAVMAGSPRPMVYSGDFAVVSKTRKRWFRFPFRLW